MPNWPIQRRLHNLIYHSSRNYKPPVLIDPQKLAHKWHCTPHQVSLGLCNLNSAGFIRRCDATGKTATNQVRASHALLQLLIDNGGKLPWDRHSRYKWAAQLGIRHSSLETYKREVNSYLHTEYNDRGWPTEIMLLNDYDAELLIDGKDMTLQSRYGCHYYKYVKGWQSNPDRGKKPKPQPEVKPKPLTIGAKFLIYLAESGGTIHGTRRSHAEKMGVNRYSFNAAIDDLMAKGLVTWADRTLSIKDAAAVSSFLARFGVTPVLKAAERISVSPTNLSVGEDTRVENSNYVAVSTSPLTPHERQRPVTKGVVDLLKLLVLRREIERQIVVTRLRYPRGYLPAVRRIEMLYNQQKMVSEEETELARRQNGAMFDRQKDLCIRMLTTCKYFFGLTGPIMDALAAECTNLLKGVLPTVNDPQREAGDALADWIDNEMPVDDTALNWVQQWSDSAKADTISEFACRGGLDLILRVMEWSQAEPGVIQHQLAWNILLYITWCKFHSWNDRYPEQWATMSQFTAHKSQTGQVHSLSVVQALCDYWDYEYPTTSLQSYRKQITAALNETYPFRNEETGEIGMCRVWRHYQNDAEDNYEDEAETISQWVLADAAAEQLSEKTRVERFTEAWYRQKIADVDRFGQPGDVEILWSKVSALQRWTKVSEDEQKTQLVGILNRPTAYDDPRLNWKRWDRKARPVQQKVEAPTQAMPKPIKLEELMAREGDDDDDGARNVSWG